METKDSSDRDAIIDSSFVINFMKQICCLRRKILIEGWDAYASIFLLNLSSTLKFLIEKGLAICFSLLIILSFSWLAIHSCVKPRMRRRKCKTRRQARFAVMSRS